MLFEASSRLGGQVAIAALADWRKDLKWIVDWLESGLHHLGVSVLLNRFVEADDILKKTPDAVIVATGGLPDDGEIRGGELCQPVWDVLTGPPPRASSVIVVDGTGQNGASPCANYLSGRGVQVTMLVLIVILG